MTCQSKGRSPTRAIGLGPVLTPSRIRIPSPPQKRTTFTISPHSDDVKLWNGKDQSRPPCPGVLELLADFLLQVPWQHKDVVRPGLCQAIGRMNRNVSSRQEPSLLYRAAVDRVLDKIFSDPAMIEQRVALARCAVSSNRPTFPRRADQKVEQVTLDAQDFPGKSSMSGQSVQAGPALLLEQVPDAICNLTGPLGGARVHT